MRFSSLRGAKLRHRSGLTERLVRWPAHVFFIELALLIWSGSGSPLSGQTVRGQLLQADNSQPVEGALVLLLDLKGKERHGFLTDQAGRFILKAPGPGSYTVRAQRMGYQSVESDTLNLLPGGETEVLLLTSYAPIPMEELRVEGDRRCVVRPEEGAALAALWDEARKALVIQDWTAREEVFPFEIFRYRRRLDPTGRTVLSETREPRKTVLGGMAVRSRPASNLVSEGFAQPLAGMEHSYEYFGPDASVLLSDEFLDTHCLKLAVAGDDASNIGVAFEPVRDQGIPDIKGTLWLSPESARLRYLEYEYTWAPLPEVLGLAGGRVDFEGLPNGGWIVRDWWIRTPVLEVDWSGPPGQRAEVMGYVEEGEEVTRMLPSGEEAVPLQRGTVVGTVRDATRGSALENARVYLSGTEYASATDTLGRFMMDGIREGVFTLAFTHPTLDSIGVYPPGVEVSVRAGEVSEVDLTLPGSEALLGQLCGDVNGWIEGEPAVVGTIFDAQTGAPRPGAQVSVVWVDYRIEGSGDVFGDRQSLEATADGKGRFHACGVGPGALVTVRAASGSEEGVVREVLAPFGSIVRVDVGIRF